VAEALAQRVTAVGAATAPVVPSSTLDPTFSIGDLVEHQALGSGIVSAIEPGGILTVRFSDGAVRRLMTQYAPLRKIVFEASDEDIPF
jgi:PcrA/UvrD tudor domain